MAVTLLLFASAREAAGRARDEFALAPDTTLGALLDRVETEYGEAFAAILANARVWIDGEEPEQELFGGAVEQLQVRRHARAGVEHHHRRERLRLAREQRDVGRLAVVEDREVVLGEIGDEATSRVEHGGIHRHRAHAGPEDRLILDGGGSGPGGACRVRSGERQAGQCRRDDGNERRDLHGFHLMPDA